MRFRFRALGIAILGVISACSPGTETRSDALDGIPGLNGLRPGATLPPPPELRGVRERVLSLVESGEIPSMSIAVARAGRVIWLEAFGYADVERKIAATPRTTYRLGSLSKSLLATGLMALVDSGHLDFDTPIADILGAGWLPNPHPGAAGATVLDVLAMRAGVPHGWTSYVDESEVPRGFEARKAHFGALLFSAFPPGEVFEYSNFSYGVGELLIEGTTGLTIADYMKQKVFVPLGMDDSSADTKPGASDNVATPYNSSGEALPHSHALPGGGLGYFSSAHDLLRFGAYHLGWPLGGDAGPLQPESRELMRRFENVAPNLFHLGWWGDEQGYVSNGSVGGANSHLKIVPGADLVIVTLMNRSGFQADQMTDEIAAALIPGEAERAARARQAYMERYERPYRPDHGFAGRWKGEVDPFGRAVPITLDAGSEITIDVGGEAGLVLRGPRTSVLGRLSGDLDPERMARALGMTRWGQARLKLALREEGLVGYLAWTTSDDTRSISRPIFVRLTRVG